MCAILLSSFGTFILRCRTNYCASSNDVMPIAYDIATVTLAATMVGNEFAVAAFIHPQIRKLNNSTHAQTAAPLAAVLGKAMPLWYGLVLMLIGGAAVEHRPVSSGAGLLLVSAASLWAATIVFTITMLVPINNRIAKMNTERPYTGWLQDRARWDRLHQIRVALLSTALVLLLAGLLR
jgi:FtsH-binding integral membrane protein